MHFFQPEEVGSATLEECPATETWRSPVQLTLVGQLVDARLHLCLCLPIGGLIRTARRSVDPVSLLTPAQGKSRAPAVESVSLGVRFTT